MAGLQVEELSAKLADAESKKAAVEATLALRERQASEVIFLDGYIIYMLFSTFKLSIKCMPCRRRGEK